MKRNKTFFFLMWCGVIAILIAILSRIVINESPSVPWKYLVKSFGKPAINDVVLVCLPKNEFTIQGIENGYIGQGSCDDGAMPVIKILAAKSGDRISINEKGVFINGLLWMNSEPKSFDKKGRQLKRIELNEYKLKENEVLLMTKEKNSFDGRYFGLVHKQNIISVLLPIGGKV